MGSKLCGSGKTLILLSVVLVMSPALAGPIFKAAHASYEGSTPSAILSSDHIQKLTDMCSRIFKKQLKVNGDLQDLGKKTVNEYYFADGSYEARTQDLFMNTSRQPCIIDIKPVTLKKVFDLKGRFVYSFSSLKASNGKKGWHKRRLISVQDAGRAASAIANHLSETPAIAAGIQPIGKDKVLSMDCDIFQFQTISVCVWKSGQQTPPRSLNLYHKIRSSVAGSEDVVKLVAINFLSEIKAEDILPPPEVLK